MANPIKLQTIRIDGGTQPRDAINENVVAEYAEALTAGDRLPSVVVFFDGAENWLADGFHRYHAHRKIGALDIDADVRPGTRRDAVLYSVGANAAHGLRRTNDDKRRAVQTLLADGEWSAWSDREIAKACGVSHPFVAALRDPGAAERQKDNRARSAARAVESDSTHVDSAADVQPVDRPALESAEAQPPSTAAADQDASSESKPAQAAAKAAPTASTADVEALRQRISDLEDERDAYRDRNHDLEQENEALRMSADPQVLARIEALQAHIRTLESQRDSHMNRSAELAKELKSLNRRLGKPNA